jgi:hypothetical protein
MGTTGLELEPGYRSCLFAELGRQAELALPDPKRTVGGPFLRLCGHGLRPDKIGGPAGRLI